jgi:hypothetical protein
LATTSESEGFSAPGGRGHFRPEAVVLFLEDAAAAGYRAGRLKANEAWDDLLGPGIATLGPPAQKKDH